MKLFMLLISGMLSLGVIAQKTTSPKSSPTSAPVKLSNINDSIQYAIGAFVAQWINNNGFIISNPALYIKGMDDVFQNKPRLIPDSVVPVMITAYQQVTQKDRSLKLEQQLFTNIKQRPGLGILPNGVHYFILKSAQGQRPLPTDTVTIQLRGTLADGTVFEDTYRKSPVKITPAEMVPGVSEALQMMPVGSKWQIYVPAMLAYADKGTAVIPPNSALVLEIELLNITSPKKE
ncbi:FKBP-type peptidyl-prolyl cis-trans isomerase [Sediminibacterium sp. KACHI17]|jgi:FKBP-type peptidyl-prolyl cis-trans isomerase FklB